MASQRHVTVISSKNYLIPVNNFNLCLVRYVMWCTFAVLNKNEFEVINWSFTMLRELLSTGMVI